MLELSSDVLNVVNLRLVDVRLIIGQVLLSALLTGLAPALRLLATLTRDGRQGLTLVVLARVRARVDRRHGLGRDLVHLIDVHSVLLLLVYLDEYLFEALRRQPLVIAFLLFPNYRPLAMYPILSAIIVNGLGVFERLVRDLGALVDKYPVQMLLGLEVASAERRVCFLIAKAAAIVTRPAIDIQGRLLRVSHQLLGRLGLVVGAPRVLLHASVPFVANDGVLRASIVWLHIWTVILVMAQG